MKEITLKHEDICNQVQSIVRKIQLDNWTPDIIVGIARGGLVAATMISHYLRKPLKTLNVSFRDGAEPPSIDTAIFKYLADGLNVLIFDDINDSGNTLLWIKEKLSIVNVTNLRFGTLVENAGSKFKGVEYYGMEIDKREEDVWINFWWENWWENR